MKKTHALLAATLLFGATINASALGNIAFNFDSQASNTSADLFAPVGFHINYGQFADQLDAFGDPTGKKYWIPDTGTVPASNPAVNGYGAAPSGTNALNALDGPILLTFDQPYNLTLFSTTLDNSTFGDLGDTSILFYDANDNQIASYAIDETVSGLQFSTSSALAGVAKIVLPGNAFYDNVNFQGATAVPEPSSLAMVAIALSGAFFVTRKLKKSVF